MAGSGDLLVKLLLNSNGFDNGIKKSKKQVSDFERQGASSGSSLVKTFGKITAAALTIQTAKKAFEAFIGSSQTLGDTFGATMQSAKTVVDNFVYAVSNADFSSFNSGLGDMISKAREAYAAYDQLSNTMMASSYVQATEGATYREAMSRARNKDLSEEERLQALKEAKAAGAEIEEAARVVASNSMNALRKDLAAKTDLSELQITDEALEKYFKLDAKEAFDEQRKNLEKQYAEYLEEIDAIKDKYPTALEKFFGAGSGKKGKNQKAQEAALAELTDRYKEVIVGYELLYRESDEDLAKMYETAKSAVAARNQASEIITSTNEVGAAIVKSGQETRKKIAEEKEKLEREAAEMEALRQEQQALFAAVNYGGPNITMAMGVKFDNSDIHIDARNKALISGKPIAQYREADPLADLPKTIAKLDESALPTISFGSDEQTETFMTNIESMTSGVEGLNSAFSALGGVIGEDNTQMLTFIDNILQSAMAITTFISQTVAEIAVRKKNKAEAIGEAAAKAMSAHASIPFAGIAAGIAAVSAIIATIQSIPKFADGGIVTSATLGVFGEAGPEAVMPLDRLNDFVRDREVRVTGEIVGRGKDLSVIINNYNKVRNVKS